LQQSAFAHFDQDHTNDIDFKKFCFALTTVLYGSPEEQQEFVAHIFDVDHDDLLGPNDMRLAFHACAILNRTSPGGPLTPAELKLAETRLSETVLNLTPQQLNKQDLFNVIEKFTPPHEFLSLFQLIPTPREELDAITRIYEQGKLRREGTCHIVSAKWLRAWHSFVKAQREPPNKYNKHYSNPSATLFFPEEDVPVYPVKTANQGHKRMIPLSPDTTAPEREELHFYMNEPERPDEIDNAELEASVKGQLKEGLKVSLPLTWVAERGLRGGAKRGLEIIAGVVWGRTRVRTGAHLDERWEGVCGAVSTSALHHVYGRARCPYGGFRNHLSDQP
jgi:hypothetical protein